MSKLRLFERSGCFLLINLILASLMCCIMSFLFLPSSVNILYRYLNICTFFRALSSILKLIFSKSLEQIITSVFSGTYGWQNFKTPPTPEISTDLIQKEPFFPEMNKNRIHIDKKNTHSELSMPPPLTRLQENHYLNTILTTVLTCTFNETRNTRFSTTEVSILKENAFCVILLCFIQNMFRLVMTY